MSKRTCQRKEQFADLEKASIAARHIRQKRGLSRRSKDVSVYICDVCYWLHVGTTLTDQQRQDRRTLAERWAEVQELRRKAEQVGEFQKPPLSQ